ncbi:MAG: phage major capsid protein [Clostridia bacterium]|nr:phage major capsid protein [Clostridia bacterium]
MVTLSTADKALKDLYLEVVSDQLNSGINPFYKKILKTTRDVYGNSIKKLVPYGLNGGIGAGTESGNLPAASGNKYAQFQLTLKNLYGQIEISDKAIRASEHSEGAFVNLLNAEMEGLIKASRLNFARMLFGDGSGKLADVSSVSNSVVTVSSTRNFDVGMVVDFYDGDTLTIGGLTIIGIDKTNSTITMSATPTGVTSDDDVFVQGSKGLEITGLGAIFATGGTLYGLSKTDNAWLKPLSYIAANSTLTEAAVLKALDDMDEAAGSQADIIITTHAVRRALVKLLMTSSRQVNTVELEGGYTSVSYNGIPVIADRFCPDGYMYLLNTNDFNLHQLCDWRWLEGENGRVIKQTTGKAVYTATLVKYADLICNKPCGQAVITGITQ